MKTWIKTQTCCYDDGRVTCHIIGTVQSETKPESKMVSLRRCDAWTDYHASIREAEKFCEEAKKA